MPISEAIMHYDYKYSDKHNGKRNIFIILSATIWRFVSPSGTYAYVANHNSDNVIVLNAITNTIAGQYNPQHLTDNGNSILPNTLATNDNCLRSESKRRTYGTGNIVLINSVTDPIPSDKFSFFLDSSSVTFSQNGKLAYISQIATF